MSVDASAVLRKITEGDRRKIFHIAKKFLQGMIAWQSYHGFDYTKLLPRFKTGEFDNIIMNTTNPSVMGRYWPWITTLTTDGNIHSHLTPLGGAGAHWEAVC